MEWKPIETAPKDGRTILLGYFNSAGKWRTTRGQWMSQNYIDEYAEDPDCMSPGWHETEFFCGILKPVRDRCKPVQARLSAPILRQNHL